MLSQYYLTESGVEFRRSSVQNPHYQNEPGVHFRLPLEQNQFYQIPNPLQHHQQPNFIDMNQVFDQENTAGTPKNPEKRTASKKSHKKREHRGARKKTQKKHKRSGRKGRGDKKRRAKTKLRYKTVKYERQLTGANQLIFGSMFCWGMNAITAWYLVMEIKDPNMKGVPADAFWLYFAIMAMAFYVAGAFMHHVKRTASAYCCWIAALVPVMLGCICLYRLQTNDFEENYPKWNKQELMNECVFMCIWFAYLTVLYIIMGTEFYRYRGQGFTKVLK